MKLKLAKTHFIVAEKLKKDTKKKSNLKKKIVKPFEALEELAKMLIHKSREAKLFEAVGLTAMRQDE